MLMIDRYHMRSTAPPSILFRLRYQYHHRSQDSFREVSEVIQQLTLTAKIHKV